MPTVQGFRRVAARQAWVDNAKVGLKKVRGEKMENKSVVQAEGKAHQEDAKADAELHKAVDKIHKRKAAKPEPQAFPAESSINAYAFLRVPAKVMEFLGVKTEKNGAGKEIYKITKATITGYDASAKVLTIKLA
jgi:hypothetical protein